MRTPLLATLTTAALIAAAPLSAAPALADTTPAGTPPVLTSAHYTRTDISVGETAVMELNLAGGSQQVEHYTGCVTETIDGTTITTTPYTDATLHSADYDRTYRTITALPGAHPDSTYTVSFYEHIDCADTTAAAPTQTQTLTLVPPTVITSLAWSDPDISTGDTSHMIINGTGTTVRGWTGCTAPHRTHGSTRHNWATSLYNDDYAWTTDTDFTVTYNEVLNAGFSDGDTLTWTIYPDVDCDHIAGQTPIEAAFTFHKDPSDNKTPTLAFSNEYLPNPDDETTLTINGYSGHVFTMTYNGTDCTVYPLSDFTNTFTAADFPDTTTFSISVYEPLTPEWAYLHPHSTCTDLADQAPLATATAHFGTSAPQDPEPPTDPTDPQPPTDTTDDDHPTNTGGHEPLTDYGTPTTSTQVLERTGADITLPLTAGAALILTGAGLLTAARRRHNS